MKVIIPSLVLLLWLASHATAVAAGLSQSWSGAQVIPDNDGSGLAYSFTLSDTRESITNIEVTLDISGGLNGDLYVYLSHGDGFAVLLNRAGRSATNDSGYVTPGLQVTLTGASTRDIHTYQTDAPAYNGGGQLTGVWAADGREVSDTDWALDTTPRTATLAAFNGLNPNGTWTIYFRDTAGVGISTLNSWSVTVAGEHLAPAITSQPTNQSALAGDNVTFTAAVEGAAPVSYQWYFNSAPVTGATASELTRTTVLLASAGNYTLVASNGYGCATSSVAVLAVSKGNPNVLTWPAATAITYGQTLAASSLSGGSASVGGLFTFTTISTAPVSGAALQSVTFTPGDAVNYNAVSGSVSVTVNKAATEVSAWPTAAAITYGQTLAGSVLSGGSASMPGLFAFTTPSTVPGAGTASQSVVFNPTDTNYSSVSGSASLTVSKALAPVVFVPSSLIAVYDGTAKSPTPATTPGGLAASLTFNGSSAAPTNPGSCTVVGTISDANYEGSVTNEFRIAMSGPAVAWGFGGSGQLGNASDTNSTVPVEMTASGALAGKSIVGVAAGVSSSYALTSDGLVYAWGDNGSGQLGDAGNCGVYSLAPVLVDTNGALAGKRVVSIVATEQGVLALSSDGALFTWGWNYNGALGNGSEDGQSGEPVAVDMSGALAGKTVVALGAGAVHYLVATSDGKVFGWGDGASGQLGQGADNSSPVPVAVDMSGALLGKTVVAVAGGGQHSVALTADGLAYAWGAGGDGQLGNGASTNSNVPAPVASSGVLAGQTLTAIGAAAAHSLAVSSDGRVYAWGAGSEGQLGDGAGAASTVPVAVATSGALLGKRVVSVCATYGSSSALTDDGLVFSWGANGSGELGRGSFASSLVPVAVYRAGVLAGQTVLAIASSSQAYHVVAVTAGLSAPLLTSATNAGAVYGQAYSFTVAGRNVAGRAASGLPGWLAFDPDTGILSGTPSSYGVWNLTVIVTNAFGSTTGSLALTVAHAPVVVQDTLGAVQNKSVALSAARFSCNDTNADGNPMTLTGVSSFSAGGGRVRLLNGTVTYTPLTGATGTDSFTYTLSDGFGNFVTGTVTVTIASATGPSLNVVFQPVVDSGAGEFVVRFAGTPGAAYAIESTATLDPPNWQWRTMVTAPADNSHGLGRGIWEYRDPTGGATVRYYRTVYPAYDPHSTQQ